jgi:DNA-binding NarL/FixJ family response regulator
MPNRKTVLVIEDEELVRLPLVSALQMRGFHAVGAATVDEARALIEQLEDNIDVMVLDMRLEDPKYPDITGAKLGLEVRSAHPKWLPPEFLIFSAYRQNDYYEAAWQLGAAAYLKKNIAQADLIRHIRSLALRRALSVERKDIEEKIERIAEVNDTPAAAIINFCHQVLASEMKACLGAPSIFLLSDSNGTQNSGSDTTLELGYHPAYERIQALTFGAVNSADPFVFDLKEISGPPDAETHAIYEKLEGGAFLPLFITHGLRLSIGILRADDVPLPEEPDKLARILSTYLRPAIIEHLLNFLTRLTDLNARKDAEKKTLLENTSRFCLYVGQTQLDILDEALAEEKIESGTEYFHKLKKLALDLCATGNEFSQLSNISGPSDSAGRRNAHAEPVAVSSVIAQAWREIGEQFSIEKLTLKEQGENFNLAIDRNDLLVAVLRVLQWMVQREDKLPAGAKPEIRVEYVRGDGYGEILFTDQSRRLGPQLRQKLFEPFTQATPPPLLSTEDDDEKADRPGLYLPLYLAKTLVEVKNDGVLEDQSDSVEGKLGHRFVMRLPMVKEQSFSTKAFTGGQ